MATIVIGGSGRNVGKTTLVCGILAALPEFGWTVVKITSHMHGLPEPIFEETVAGQGTDTGRYLAAGARRALFVTAPEKKLPIEALRNTLGSDVNLIFESNRIVDIFRPDICLAILGDEEASKPTFAALLPQADALVMHPATVLQGVQIQPTTQMWRLENFSQIPADLVDWLRARCAGR